MPARSVAVFIVLQISDPGDLYLELLRSLTLIAIQPASTSYLSRTNQLSLKLSRLSWPLHVRTEVDW